MNATLARLADAVGDRPLAWTFQEADRRERAARAEPYLDAARKALAAGTPEQADRPLIVAAALLPGNLEVAWLEARWAIARPDPAALTAILAKLRRWAPSLEAAVIAENRFRSSQGLPLLPEEPAEHFVR